LFDLQLQDYEFSQAEETLKILRQQIGGDATLVCELKLAGKRKDFDAARAHFKALCLSSTSEMEHLVDAMEADMECDWNTIVDRVLIEALDSKVVNRNVRAIVAERYIKRSEWDRAEHHLRQIPPTDSLWRRVANSYLEALARAGKGNLFWNFISTN